MNMDEPKDALDAALQLHAAVTIKFVAERANRVKL
jgi:hypothetical protein